MAGANLAGANLARADMSDANLAGADMSGANMADANLAGAHLVRADLADAYLAGADMSGADMAGANMADANLAGANLARADMSDANLADANLARAYMADAYMAGAYLADADLAGADMAGADMAGADLAGAYMAGARNVPAGIAAETPAEPYARRPPMPESPADRARRYRERCPDVPVVEHLDARILSLVEAGEGRLEMSAWHTCETTHCRAGWAIHLAGEQGRRLEERHGPAVAGAMIYRASTGRVPHFHASNERALEDIRRCADMQKGEG
jgi:hypothetical protein